MTSSEIVDQRSLREGRALAALAAPATDLAERAATLARLPEWAQWTTTVAEVAKLASYVAGTDFVPVAMRDNPAAVTACILTGAEMHLGPMAALRHLHIVKGKVGMSAELMRAKIFEAGHDIRYVETTDTRCVVEGRRRGSPHDAPWTRVTFTADQAKRMGITLSGGAYTPEDKLLARATSRLARRVFPDVIAGLPTVDEIEDEQAVDTAPAGAAPTTGATTPRRRRASTAAATPATAPVGPATAAAPPPPLPGEPGYATKADTAIEVEADTAEAAEAGHIDAGPDPADRDDEPDARPVTKAMQNKIFALMREAGLDGDANRGGRLRVCEILTRRTLTSSNDLTRSEAALIIDTIEPIEDKERHIAALLADDERERAADAAREDPPETDTERKP